VLALCFYQSLPLCSIPFFIATQVMICSMALWLWHETWASALLAGVLLNYSLLGMLSKVFEDQEAK